MLVEIALFYHSCMSNFFKFFYSGNDFYSSTVGIAFVDRMCSSSSIGVVQDSHHSSLSTGSTFAHELGHIFSCYHDTSECLYVHTLLLVPTNN